VIVLLVCFAWVETFPLKEIYICIVKRKLEKCFTLTIDGFG